MCHTHRRHQRRCRLGKTTRLKNIWWWGQMPMCKVLETKTWSLQYNSYVISCFLRLQSHSSSAFAPETFLLLWPAIFLLRSSYVKGKQGKFMSENSFKDLYSFLQNVCNAPTRLNPHGGKLAHQSFPFFPLPMRVLFLRYVQPWYVK